MNKQRARRLRRNQRGVGGSHRVSDHNHTLSGARERGQRRASALRVSGGGVAVGGHVRRYRFVAAGL